MHDGPYGDAVEAAKGRGVAWLAPNGELLGVELDDVRWLRDEQSLELRNGDVVAVRVVHRCLPGADRSASGRDGSLEPLELRRHRPQGRRRDERRIWLLITGLT